MNLLSAWTKIAQRYENEMRRQDSYYWNPDIAALLWKRAMRARLHEKRSRCLACALTAGAKVQAVTRREIPMHEAPAGPQPVCVACAAELDREDCK